PIGASFAFSERSEASASRPRWASSKYCEVKSIAGAFPLTSGEVAAAPRNVVRIERRFFVGQHRITLGFERGADSCHVEVDCVSKRDQYTTCWRRVGFRRNTPEENEAHRVV